MGTVNVTNRIASQSLRGQAVIVSLDGTDSIGNLGNFAVGMLCQNNSSSKTGTIHGIDVYGHSFRVEPIQPDRDFSSASTYGYLAVGETVIVTLS